MPVITMVVHPKGLHPLQAAMAWAKHKDQDMSLRSILREGEVVNMDGDVPTLKTLWAAIDKVDRAGQAQPVPRSKYENCGRTKLLSDDDVAQVVTFVKKWRHKRFCTCQYIKRELKLSASPRTINRALNAAGYFWRKVPKVQGLSPEQLKKRKAFVDAYVDKPAAWWQEHMNMVLDGVTLTVPPKPLSAKQKHAAQRITCVWTCAGERLDNDIHTFNRYGVQLGKKVPLWGGFTGNGQFTLRMWTPTPKMDKEDWQALVPTVKAAVDDAYGDELPARPKVWHDNERFLLCPGVYKDNGLTLFRFPPNSGDLNPIETVWAWLRRDLAKREQDDLEAGRHLTEQMFRQRCAQILNSYSAAKPGQPHSPLQQLIRGMPKRLANSKANNYGRCGK